MNRKIIVRNVGPIKDEVTMVLNRINILIGQQSVGKSTLAKIACYCSWVEKEISILQSPELFEQEGYFVENLEVFHKLNGFFNENSFISFSSDVLSFKYEKKKFDFQWGKKRWEYKRRKTLYIPAERNIVAVIPNWFEVKLEDNNTRSYLADWEGVRKYHTGESPMPLVGANKYYFNQSDKSDHIITSDGTDVLLKNASSGMQTLAPLQVLVKHYSEDFYEKKLYLKEDDIDYKKRLLNFGEKLRSHLLETELTKKERETYFQDVKKYNELYKDSTSPPFDTFLKIFFPNQNFRDKFNSTMGKMWVMNSTAFFIEEPELNLYPSSQYELVRGLIELLHDKQHTVFITTHSPYILTTLNNLIYAAETAKEHPNEVRKIVPENLWVKKEDVSAWKLTENSVLENLMSSEVAMVKAEEIDDISSTINDEFDRLFELEQTDIL